MVKPHPSIMTPLKVRLQGLALILLPPGIYFIFLAIGNTNKYDSIPAWGEDLDTSFSGCFFALFIWSLFFFWLWVLFVRKTKTMIIDGWDEYKSDRDWERERERERQKMMRCYHCNVEHKVKNKENHLKKCIKLEKEKLAKIEAKRKKENDPNLMTAKRKSQLEEIADRVFPNARYFKYKGEKMELTTDIGGFKYSSCNSRSIESIDKQMVADASRGYNRRNKPKSKNKSSVAKSYSGVCSQQKRNHSTCGSPTDSRCPRCSRYACGSCRGSRTYNGRRVCEACNRNMSGD